LFKVATIDAGVAATNVTVFVNVPAFSVLIVSVAVPEVPAG